MKLTQTTSLLMMVLSVCFCVNVSHYTLASPPQSHQSEDHAASQALNETPASLANEQQSNENDHLNMHVNLDERPELREFIKSLLLDKMMAHHQAEEDDEAMTDVTSDEEWQDDGLTDHDESELVMNLKPKRSNRFRVKKELDEKRNKSLRYSRCTFISNSFNYLFI